MKKKIWDIMTNEFEKVLKKVFETLRRAKPISTPVLFMSREEYIAWANFWQHPICYRKWNGHEVYITYGINI